MLKGAEQPSSYDPVEFSDDRETPLDLEVGVEGKSKDKELSSVVANESKAAGKKVAVLKGSGKGVEGSASVSPGEVYVPGWKATVGNSFKSSSVCEDEKAWVVKVGDLTSRHEVEVNELKKQMEALNVREKAYLEEKEGLKTSFAQVTSDNKWLIEHGFQQVVTYLLHSSEFNKALGDVYTKLLVHGRHRVFTTGYKACEPREPQDKSSLFHPKAFEVFKDSVLKMEHLTYPFVGEVSECFGKPLFVLQELKPHGLNEVVCAKVLKSLSKKRPCSSDSEKTFSEGGEGSKGSSLEASEATGASGRKNKKAKKP
ncbi:hypothetical protein Hdeb2414_s0007g00225231 [Helianthus debilis subsp. tardiflorus]